MRYLSYVGLGLSVVFGCLFLALVAELYYLLCRKKKLTSTEIEDGPGIPESRYFPYISCWKKPSSLCSKAPPSSQNVGSSLRITETHETQDPELLLKPLEEGLNTQHYLSGLPRFLFTIKEETREDLESEDGKSQKSRKTRSFSELVANAIELETPFWTPLASPYLTPPQPPKSNLETGSKAISELSGQWQRQSPSPPPKFKFLKDAEEKLQRRKMSERAAKERRVIEASAASMVFKDEKDEDGPLTSVTLAANTSKEAVLNHQPSSSQVVASHGILSLDIGDISKATKKEKFELHLSSIP